MSKFIVSKRRDDDYQFNLIAENGQVILTSQGYTTNDSCQNGIASVRTHAASIKNFECNKSANDKDYFNLKAANHQVIGTSEMYASKAGIDTGIASVMKNAPLATIED
jgi:uncharacterized protein